MGLLFVHSEDKKYHIYRMGNKVIWILYFFLFFILLLMLPYLLKIAINSDFTLYSTFSLILLWWLIAATNFVPLWFRKWAAIGNGKKVIQTGKFSTIFQGYKGLGYEIKIEK
ncbi:hypothetical protein HYX00_03675 [Candidatus Woesearchaeota archaeon]|nr:hypothetical protein [Candidatus Woesearchaeota archaeon]